MCVNCAEDGGGGCVDEEDAVGGTAPSEYICRATLRNDGRCRPEDTTSAAKAGVVANAILTRMSSRGYVKKTEMAPVCVCGCDGARCG